MSRFVIALALALAYSPPANAQTEDHLKCYKVKDLKVFGSATADLDALQPQFADDNCKISAKSSQLCVPVEKRVTELEGGPLIEFPAQDLQFAQLCYKIKCPKDNIAPQTVTDQFGTRQIEKFKTTRLCTPAMDL